jgi:Leucine-rich repeat (LRR) protein
LQWLYVYSNGSIAGPLPDFSKNTQMSGIYIRNTNTNGPLPNLVSNPSLYYLRLDSNAMTGTVPAWSTNSLRYVFCYNNQIAGSLPALNTPYLYYLYLQNNNISGNLPLMGGAIRLQRLYLNSNSITGYTTNALKYNTSLSIIDLSNNQLPASVSAPIINDLYDNYAGNPRNGVSVNLLGNAGLSRKVINRDNEGENSLANKLAFLESRWTILLDAGA